MITTGICYWFGYEIPNKERFELIKESSFDNVFLWWGDEFASLDGDKNLLPEMARNAGLIVENVHAPFDKTNYLWTDSINAENIVKRYMDCLIDCESHNIPTVVIHLTNGYNPPPASQIGLDRIKSLVELAERKNVNIALENLRKPEYLEFVFSNIQSDKLGFCYDSGHENCYSHGANLLDKYGNKLIALHLHDNDGSDDQHRVPGEGTIDWFTIVKKIQSTNYKGAISLEVTNEFSSLYSKVSAQDFLKISHESIISIFS